MKWITHEVVAVGGAWLLGMPAEALAGTLLGSILPDVLDQGIARLLIFRRLAFKRLHRGPTHWFGWWLALFLAMLAQVGSLSPEIVRAPELAWAAMGIGFGALVHVLLDMCTPSGVPVTPWSRKPSVSLKLCSTGSLKEFTFLALTLLVLAVFAYEDLAKLFEAFQQRCSI